jgi:hypothetical protein
MLKKVVFAAALFCTFFGTVVVSGGDPGVRVSRIGACDDWECGRWLP